MIEALEQAFGAVLQSAGIVLLGLAVAVGAWLIGSALGARHQRDSSRAHRLTPPPPRRRAP